ncbi:MAG: hypothetical protein Phog2KO_19300 [Phototrophicaceae bacterium]
MASEFPSDWHIANFEDAMDEIIDYRGKTAKKSNVGIPLLSAKVIKNGRLLREKFEYIPPQDYDEWMRRGIPKPTDIVMTTEAPLGEIAQLDDGKYALGQRLVTLRGKQDYLDNTYLKYQMLSLHVQHQLNARATGTTVLGIKQRELRQIELIIPPLEEQRAIAHILGSLDDKIEANRRMNETLENTARAIFKSWFVDFDPVHAKANGETPEGMSAETADLFPDDFQESELGLIPRGWSALRLEQVLEVIETGKRPRGGIKGITKGVPSIGAESIVGLGMFDYAKTKYVPEDFFTTIKKGIVEDRDVLLYKDGGRPGVFLPHVSMFGDGFPFHRMALNSHVFRIRGNSSISQEFLYLWMSSPLIMHEMHLRGGGAAIPGINQTTVKGLPALLPSQDIIRSFDKQVSSLISKVFSNCNENRILAELRDTLLPRLISGELRVEDVREFVEDV